MGTPIKLDVFGRLVLAHPTADGWSLYYLSDDGKRRSASDIFVPADVSDAEIENLLADICHEWATEKNPEVRRIQ